jgi:FeS assembly protein IscX
MAAQSLTWQNAGEIGVALYEAHPDTDPLSLSFVQLHKLVTELAGFAGDGKGSNEGLLEGIQMAWYDEWKLDHG